MICLWEYVPNQKILIFHVYFFNMDISLIIIHIGLQICIHIVGICLEGRVPQNSDIGLSVCFMLCRRRENIRPFFYVFYVSLPYLDPEISPL